MNEVHDILLQLFACVTDDIEIDEPVPTVSSSLTANNDRKGKNY